MTVTISPQARAGFLALLVVAISGCSEVSQSTTPSTTSATVGAGITVADHEIMRNGSPFLITGFNMVGVLSPPGCSNTVGVEAHQHFGQSEMDAARRWHANTMRFQVSQPGLSTASSNDRAHYLQQIKDAVTLARNNGFVVILSMQDQGIGCGQAHALPSTETVTAWHLLAPIFAGDTNVIFELFNEPHNDAKDPSVATSQWSQWQLGGSQPLSDDGSTVVGHQQLLDHIRADGANNIVIADGADHAEHLEGIPMLTDHPGGRGIAYAVHPYSYSLGKPDWDMRFGYLTATAPVVATEWDYLAADCGKPAQTLGPQLLNYFLSHHIGLTAHAFDVPHTQVTGNWTWTPTQCGTTDGGSGHDVLTYFSRLAEVLGSVLRPACGGNLSGQ